VEFDEVVQVKAVHVDHLKNDSTHDKEHIVPLKVKFFNQIRFGYFFGMHQQCHRYPIFKQSNLQTVSFIVDFLAARLGLSGKE